MFTQRAFATAIILGLFGTWCAADDAQPAPPADEATVAKTAILDWMQHYAEDTQITLKSEDGDVEAELVPRAVFRYSDAEQEIPDATLWVWTRDARPVAFQKVEVNAWRGTSQWTICFASLTSDLVDVRWPAEPIRRTYESTAAGITFRPIPDADPPADNPRLRSIQIKRLKDRFTARLDPVGEARFMPRPIFEYEEAESRLQLGSIFGLSATGTNPDALLLIEARPDEQNELRWEYAPARLTNSGVTLQLDEEVVWEDPPVTNQQNVQPTWTYFFMPRQLPYPVE
jgi:hypothetical protein